MDLRYLFYALVRLLPDSLRQSSDNPLQLDRLPDTSEVEFDYPVMQQSPAAATRSTLFLLLVAAIAPGLLALGGSWAPVSLIQATLSTLVLATAAAVAVYAVLIQRYPAYALATAVVLWPTILVGLKQEHYSQLALTIVICIQVVFAERLVTHYLDLKTAAPFDKATGRELRRRWGSRWRLLSAPFPGADLWFASQFLFALLPAAVLLLSFRESPAPIQGATSFLLASAAVAAGVIFRREAVAHLFGRPLPTFRRQGAALRRALVEWWTYNSCGIRGAGVHESVVGACRARRSLLLALVLVWASLWVAFSSNVRTERQLLTEGARQAHVAMAIGETVTRTLSEAFEKQVAASLVELTAEDEAFLQQHPGVNRDNYLALKRRKAADTARPKTQRPSSTPAQSANFLVQCLSYLAVAAIWILLPAVVTLLLAAIWIYAAAAPVLAGIEQLCGDRDRERVLATERWELLVERLRSSDDECESQSLLLGTNARDDSPILIPREVFKEHAHILGDSGSGKTSIGLLPLVTQLMRFGDASVIVVDLKADDQLLLETMREEAAAVASRTKQPYPCRWFTTVLGRSSFVSNPLTQRFMAALSPEQQADVITAGLGLQYGDDYGRKYYGDANYDLLCHALRLRPNPQCFSDLELALKQAIMMSSLPRKILEAATHVQSSVRRLSRCLPLNACGELRTPAGALEHRIELADVFCQPQALYIALPPAAGISSTAEIARLFLYSLMAAAQAHAANTPRKQVYLVIDEFQRIVSHNVEVFLQQARSMNIGCILANQSLADLDRIGAELVPAVRTNTRFRQIFGAGHRDDIQDILATSGETVYGQRSWSYSPGLLGPELRGVGVGESRASRLSINDVLLATDALGRSIACLRRGAGYAQYGGMPFVMDSVFHISKKVYQQRSQAAWPAADERTVVSYKDSPTAPPSATVLDDEPRKSIRGVSEPPGPPVILDDSPATSPTDVNAEEEDDDDDDDRERLEALRDQQAREHLREKRARARRRPRP